MLVELAVAVVKRLGSGGIELVSRERSASLWIDDYRIEPEKTRIYKQVDADVYCGFGVSPLTAEIAAFCRKSGKRFLLFAGSDIDFSAKYRPEAREVNPDGPRGDICYYALMHADLILTQTDTQRKILQERFGRGGFTLRNPVDLSDSFPGPWEGRVPGKIALWIGKSDRIKRPEILLQLALAFPESEFVMVLNRSDPDIFQAVLRNKPPNVQVLEWVSFREAERLFARAFILINTSLFEGFPNTFLQAGKHGVPLLSLQVDPEGFIERCACGIVAQGSFDQLVEGFALIHADQARRSLFARNIRAYVQEHHALTEKIHQLDQLLAQWKSNG